MATFEEKWSEWSAYTDQLLAQASDKIATATEYVGQLVSQATAYADQWGIWVSEKFVIATEYANWLVAQVGEYYDYVVMKFPIWAAKQWAWLSDKFFEGIELGRYLVSTLFTAIVDFIYAIPNFLLKLGRFLWNCGEALWTGLKWLGTRTIQFFMEDLPHIMRALWNGLVDTLTFLKDSAIQFINNMVHLITDHVWPFIKSCTSKVVGEISRGLGVVWGMISQVAEQCLIVFMVIAKVNFKGAGFLVDNSVAKLFPSVLASVIEPLKYVLTAGLVVAEVYLGWKLAKKAAQGFQHHIIDKGIDLLRAQGWLAPAPRQQAEQLVVDPAPIAMLRAGNDEGGNLSPAAASYLPRFAVRGFQGVQRFFLPVAVEQPAVAQRMYEKVITCFTR